jgi:hypothetical protein
MDDGSCQDDIAGSCPEDPPTYFFAFTPLVEPRLTLPDNYGPAQNETAPALPSGIQIGWLSPVDHAAGDPDVALPPRAPGPESDTGRPASVATPWYIHSLECATIGGSCRFNYQLPGC